MKLKKGDNVIVITGKDKGKTGKIVKALPAEDRVVVEGVNMKKKHQKARRSNQKGQIIDVTYPIHVSNVMFYESGAKAKRTRLGVERGEGKMKRVSKKTGKVA